MTKWCLILAGAIAVTLPSRAADNLKLNEDLDYSTDSHDGPLITGDHLEDGAASASRAISSFTAKAVSIPSDKRAARLSSTKNRRIVQFVAVDMDKQRSAAQEDPVKRFYKG